MCLKTYDVGGMKGCGGMHANYSGIVAQILTRVCSLGLLGTALDSFTRAQNSEAHYVGTLVFSSITSWVQIM
jgi:hypothetical protein